MMMPIKARSHCTPVTRVSARDRQRTHDNWPEKMLSHPDLQSLEVVTEAQLVTVDPGHSQMGSR